MQRPLRHLDDLSPEASARLESCISRFEAAWQRGERPALDDYLTGDGPPRRAQVLELIYTDLEYRLKAGTPARVEDYLPRYPELAADRDVVLDLFAVEFELRCRTPRPGAEELERLFPKLGDELTTVVLTSRHNAGWDRRRAGPSPQGEKERRLGRYVLLEEVGSGSFGTVHKALDSELRRTVALKVPHAGRLTEARFLREARSAAALRHPGIVAVYDAGQVEGVWYLVGEFVQGQTLAERLKAGRPSLPQAVQWVAALADALAHAHHHGVIHRDVKPSNVLLDAEGRPRLTDFGLARRDAADGTVTEEGEVLGTPAYMSPEQARGEVGRIDARTDVYSLGVVLYELLAGELPFRGNNRMVLRQVLEEEPRPPRRLNDEVPRDLETVCLKAMAKEPAARYAGASDFADDLRRFLQGQPVRARPVGPVGRLMRWRRRKPALAGLTTALLLVAAVGFAGVTWQWRQAEAHMAEADHQRDRARENARQAHFAINDFIAIGHSPLLERSDLRAVRRQIWQTGLKYYGDFLEQDDNDPTFTDPSLGMDTASAYTNLGLLQEHLGLSTQADVAYSRARTLWQRLWEEDPQNTTYQIALARTLRRQGELYGKQGRPDDSLAAYHKAIGLFRSLPPHGTLSEAEPPLPVDSYVLHSPLNDSNCGFLMACYQGMGDLHERRGRLPSARDFYEQARTCGERYLHKRPDSLGVRQHLVGVYCKLVQLEQKWGHTDQALQAHRRGVEIGQRLVELAPDVPAYRLLLTHHQQRLGSLHRAAGRNEEALRSYQESDRLLDSVLRQDPGHFDARYTQGQNRYYCCTCLHGLGRRPQALAVCRQAHQLAGQLDRDHPSHPGVQKLLADACFWLGKLHAETRRQAEAITAYEEGAAVYGRLARQAPNEPKWPFMQGTCWHCAGNLRANLKQAEQAAACFRRAADLREKACQEVPDNSTWHEDTAGTWHHLGELEERLEHAEKALTAYRRAVEHLRMTAAKDRHTAKQPSRLRDFRQDVERLLQKLGREGKAATPRAESHPDGEG